ncbi:MAG TPA: hypothetical protein VFX49_17955 [Chloroflexota bacterium]|nr:hypothetical protein [Chloroflexota bacterium]
MLRDYARCEECGRLILGHEDGGAGGRAALVTAAHQRGRRVLFLRRPSTFHETCLTLRIKYHRRRAWHVVVVAAVASLATAVVTLLVGGRPELALLLVALGGYAAYLEANDVRPLRTSSATHVRLIVPS